MPAAPDKYEVKLPADFKAPEGLAFEIDQKDPLWAQAREAAHKRGMDQDTFSEFAGLFAANKINELKSINDARTAEVTKLGAAGQARIDAVVTWLNAMGGPDMKGVAETLKAYPTAAAVTGYENLIKRMSSQGGASFTQNGRDNPPAGQLSEAQYQALTPAQRLEHTRKQNGSGETRTMRQ